MKAGVLADIAERELGVSEQPRGSNTGPRILAYQRATSLDGTGWAWCAAFVCWCVAELRRKHPEVILAGFALPRTALAHGFPEWARTAGCRLLTGGQGGVRRGDIVVYNFRHIGIVSVPPAVTGFEFKAVEGNTDPAGSREGYTVALQPRRRAQVKAFIQLPFLE